jgi:hypothetical protein
MQSNELMPGIVARILRGKRPHEGWEPASSFSRAAYFDRSAATSAYPELLDTPIRFLSS